MAGLSAHRIYIADSEWMKQKRSAREVARRGQGEKKGKEKLRDEEAMREK